MAHPARIFGRLLSPGAIVAVCLALLVARWGFLIHYGRIPLLVDGPHARWIQRDATYDLNARANTHTKSLFRHEFTLSDPVCGGILWVRSFSTFDVWLDDDFRTTPPLVSGTSASPRDAVAVTLPSPLSAGHHTLYVFVTNRFGPSCLAADGPSLGIASDVSWQVLTADDAWGAVRACTDPPVVYLVQSWPDAATATTRLLPVLATLFGFALAATLTAEARGWTPDAHRVRLVVHAAWVVLCIHNIFRVPARWGFDITGHLEYIDFLLAQGRLPFATEGWTMFQPPLFYLLAAPLHAICGKFDASLCTQVVRVIPMLAGAVLIEAGYRTARIVYATDPSARTIATVVGGSLPIVVYHCQLVHNEPVSAAFVAITVLACMGLVMEPEQQRSRSSFALIGLAWGLAVLTKVTPVILAPIIVAAIVHRGRVANIPWSRIAADVATTLVVFTATCGWYFARNWYYLGRPVIGGWDRGRWVDWWQDPGFRTWPQILTFGRSLWNPIYAGCWSLPDAFYSSLWTDGWCSGMIVPERLSPYRGDWMATLAWLGLIPSICIVLGAISCLRDRAAPHRAGELVALAVCGIFVAAIYDLSLQLPIYSTCKATYMLGAAPCLAILAASGAKPILRHLWPRRVLVAGIAVWAVSVYTTFWCVTR